MSPKRADGFRILASAGMESWGEFCEYMKIKRISTGTLLKSLTCVFSMHMGYMQFTVYYENDFQKDMLERNKESLDAALIEFYGRCAPGVSFTASPMTKDREPEP